jgi:hypothetical protein
MPALVALPVDVSRPYQALSALGSTLTANDGRLTLSAAADDRKFERFPYRIVQVHIAKTARTALGDAFRAA